MTDTAGSALEGRAAAGGRRTLSLRGLAAALSDAFEQEAEQRRLFLWVPVAAGAGVVLYFAADREPNVWLATGLAVALGGLAWLARAHRRSYIALVGAAAIFAGFASAGWRTARVAAPVLDRLRITTVQGWIEEMDFRREGARFVLRVVAADGLDILPYRVRLTTRRTPDLEAGAFVEVKARLLPPSRAPAPSGYDFSRDAYYARIGAVGSVLGRIEDADAPEPPDLMLRVGMAIDRARNALARRVDASVGGAWGGDSGAIAAAMVTGKRDLISDAAKDTIRQAGIFHVITISGVQMTLVAGIFFVGLRRLLALNRTLALRWPIKKWAAAAAMVAAVGYDVMTGSRIGTERALAMTLILLAAVLFDRHALTMRNLALAALCVIAIEPEALLGASFQLSFAAVAALVAVYEARAAAAERAAATAVVIPARAAPVGWFGRRRRSGHGHGHGLKGALFATFCATSATASFMAYDFHEMNPYVLVGNPLTLAIIEVFAVPGALVGTLLYPLGLDGFVWHWVGLGIAIVMRAARLIEAAAVRQADGNLVVIGRRPSAFDAEQWLRADADARDAKAAIDKDKCDKLGCVATLADGRAVAIDLDRAAFAEDCTRAAVLVTPLYAPSGCRAPMVLDRESLRRTGAVTLKAEKTGFAMRTARSADEHRPWSPKPKPMWRWDRPEANDGADEPAE